ncbi:MAG: HD domain-containing protein [Clostridia bacterium]|nr:HD domain-containing protein [Clostridia bacterium]
MDNEISAAIKDLLISTKIKGIGKLVEHMEKEGFFTAPCSGKHHLCKEGGLAEHSLNVLKTAISLDASLGTAKEGTFSYNDLVITCLLHDLGKMGDYSKANYVPNVLKSGKVSEAEPFKTNKDLLYVPHEVRSIAIAERFINLTEEQEFAILYHNGLYGDFRYTIQGKETPLYLILHFADMWCSRVTEIEEGED